MLLMSKKNTWNEVEVMSQSLSGLHCTLLNKRFLTSWNILVYRLVEPHHLPVKLCSQESSSNYYKCRFDISYLSDFRVMSERWVQQTQDDWFSTLPQHAARLAAASLALSPCPQSGGASHLHQTTTVSYGWQPRLTVLANISKQKRKWLR